MKLNDLIELSDVIELMLDAVCAVDRDGVFVYVSPAFETVFGYKPKDVIGLPMITFVHDEDVEKTLQTVEKILSGAVEPRFENRWVHKNGNVVHVLWSAQWSEKHQVRVAVAHDISERKQMEMQLRHMAGHDSLTDLPNRALLMDRIQAAVRKVRRDQSQLSLLFIDIDGFKSVNDTHGHATGDEVLKNIAGCLNGCVRASDTVGRFGGDEFLVVLNDTGGADEALMVGENIRLALMQLFESSGLELQLSPSIGLAHYPENAADFQDLIHCADQAMYEAKKAGGNQVVKYVD